MKKLKTLISVVLSAMLVLSLVVPSMAETPYKVTVENAKANATYTLYKIFDFEKLSGTATNGNGVSSLKGVYTASASMYELLNNNDSGVEFDNKTTSTGDVYYVKDVDVIELSNYLHNIASISAEETDEAKVNQRDALAAVKISAKTPNTTGDITWANLTDDGYYFVDTTSGSLFILGTTANEVVIKDKNDAVTVDKVVKDADEEFGRDTISQIGETVSFKTTLTIQKGTIDLILHDEMSNGLTLLPETIRVTGVDAGKYDIVTDKDDISDNCDFEIVFDQAYLDSVQQATTVEVTYNAILNEAAIIAGEGNTNKTKATYSGLSTVESTTTTYTYDFELTKTNEAGAQIENAKFELYLKNDQTPIKLVKNGNKYRVATNEQIADNKVVKVTEIVAGKIIIEGLDLGKTYELLETDAPEGYNRLKDRIEIEETSADFTDLSVKNTTGTELPSTGGMGTKVLFTVGGIMMVVAFVLFTSKRRMAAED